MSSAGHILDMINRQRYNESLKKARRARFQRARNAYLEEIHRTNLHVTGKSLSPDERAALKHRIKQSIIQERRTAFIKTIIFFIVSLALLGIIINWIMNTESLALP